MTTKCGKQMLRHAYQGFVEPATAATDASEASTA